MDPFADTQRMTFSFFKLPAEVRNTIYRYCLDVQNSKVLNQLRPAREGELSQEEFLAQGSAHLNYTFDTAVLAICHQIQQEASATIKERFTLFIDVEQPKRVWICGDNSIERESTSIRLPIPLQQILPYASVLPLHDVQIQMLVGTSENQAWELWEPVYRKRIHQIVGTLGRFPALETLTILFLCRETLVTALAVRQFGWRSFAFCRERVLECFGRLRGLEKVTIQGDVKTGRASALKDLMQSPKAADEGGEVVTAIGCDCERTASGSMG